jgi:ATP-dependent exoDNAse (exonuclease V) alpha subunit
VAVRGDELHDFLQAARSAWTERGKQVLDAMPAPGDALQMHDVVLLKGAEMIELKTLEKILDAAERARAAIMLIADPQRLQAMGDMSPLRALLDRAAGIELGSSRSPGFRPWSG